MRITDILTESQQLDEGPITQAIGKGAGKIARGVANVGKDLKTGFQQGYQDPASTKKQPVAKQAPQKQGFMSAFKKALPAGQAYAKARDDAEAAGTPLPKQGLASKFKQAIDAGTGQDTQANPKVASQYAQIKASINKLDPKGKKQLLQYLQKTVAAPATTKPAAVQNDVPTNPATGKPLTEPERAAHQAAGGEFDGETGAPLPLGTKAENPPSNFEKQVADLKAKRAAEKAAQAKPSPTQAAPTATNTDQAGTGQAAATAAKAGQDPEAAAKAAMAANNPNLGKLMKQAGETPAAKTRTGGKVAGQLSQTPNAIRKRDARAAAKTIPAESVTESYVSIFRKA